MGAIGRRVLACVLAIVLIVGLIVSAPPTAEPAAAQTGEPVAPQSAFGRYRTDAVNCGGGSASVVFDEPVRGAQVVMELRQTRDMILTVTFTNAAGNQRYRHNGGIGTYRNGYYGTFITPNSPPAVSNVTRVDVAFSGRSLTNVKYCRMWVTYDSVIESPAAIGCLTGSGSYTYDLGSVRDDVRLFAEVSLFNDIIIDWQFMRADGSVITDDSRAIGTYYGGLPPTILTLGARNSGAPVDGVRFVELHLRGRGLNTVKWCNWEPWWPGLVPTIGTDLLRSRGTHAQVFGSSAGDPVNMATGAFQLDAVDLVLRAPGPMSRIIRAYNSDSTRVGPLGLGWTHSYDLAAQVSASEVVITDEEGTVLRFPRLPDGTFEQPIGVLSRLEGNEAGGIDLVRRDDVRYRFGADGRLESVSDRNGWTTTLGYDPSGLLASITDPVGRAAVVTHTPEGRIDRVTLHDGRFVDYGYSADGRLLTEVRDTRGGITRYAYTDDRLTVVTDPSNETEVRNEYDPTSGRVVRQWDGLDRPTTFGWDAATGTATMTNARNQTWTETYVGNVLVASVDPLGNRTEYLRDDRGMPLATIDPLGQVTFERYDERGNLLEQYLPDRTRQAWAYNDRNDVVSAVNGRNFVTQYAYDGDGNLAQITDANGTIVSYGYTGGLLTSVADPSGTTSFTYNQLGELSSRQTSTGTETYTYDGSSRRRTRTDARDQVWTATYDDGDNVVAERTPLGADTVSVYDPEGVLVSTTDAMRQTISYGYDAADQLTSVTRGTETETFGYDGAGNRTSAVDGTGVTMTWEYDAADRLVAQIDDGGRRTTFGYDAASRRTRITDPRGNVAGANPETYTTHFSYDAVGRVTRITDPLDRIIQHAYDANGNRISTTDAKNAVTSWQYDPVDRVSAATAPNTGVTRFAYDAIGNLTQRTDARNNVSTFTYDGDERLTRATLPGNRIWTFAYDGGGNLVEQVDANGNATVAVGDGTTTYDYDADGRLVLTDYSDPSTPDVTRTYRADGLVETVTDAIGTTTFTYDHADRIDSVSRGSDSFAYDYDFAGRLTQRVAPDASTTSYSYDDEGRLDTVTTPAGTFDLAWDAAGNLIQTTSPDGNVETRMFDAANRVTSVDNTLTGLADLTYIPDELGRPISGQIGNTSFAHRYDAMGNLTGTCRAAAPCDPATGDTWTYDLVTNRTVESVGGVATTATFDAADRLQQRTGPSTITYQFDANGNLVADGDGTYLYDAENRLTRASLNDGTVVDYSYDGDGRRIARTAGGVTTTYDWDVNGAAALLSGVSENGVAQARYSYGIGVAPVSVDLAGAQHVAHADALGSLVALTTTSGAVDAAYDYDVWGNLVTSSGTAAPANALRYTSGLQDPATGWTHLRARDYDPTVGRFVQPDPLSRAVGSPARSAYPYADNAPTAFVDPLGLRSACGVFGWAMTNLAGGDCNFTMQAALAEGAGFVAGGLTMAGCTFATGGSGVVLCAGAANAVGGAFNDWLDGNASTNPFDPTARAVDFALGAGLAFGSGRVVSWTRSSAPNTTRALPSGTRPLAEIGPAGNPGAIAGRGVADHHIFPQQFREFFGPRGVNIDDFTVTVNHQTTHLRGLHGRGLPAQGMPGGWNQRWGSWIDANPSATSFDIYRQAGVMMDDFGISGLPIHPYGKGL